VLWGFGSPGSWGIVLRKVTSALDDEQELLKQRVREVGTEGTACAQVQGQEGRLHTRESRGSRARTESKEWKREDPGSQA
jgi:hypothetical protein